VNLALTEGTAAPAGVIDHVGIQVESPAIVVEQLARVRSAGLAVREEMGVNCCHANQDKFWVQDPDGVEWEVYYLNYDLQDEAPRRMASLPVTAATCCAAIGLAGAAVSPTGAAARRRRWPAACPRRRAAR